MSRSTGHETDGGVAWSNFYQRHDGSVEQTQDTPSYAAKDSISQIDNIADWAAETLDKLDKKAITDALTRAAKRLLNKKG